MAGFNIPWLHTAPIMLAFITVWQIVNDISSGFGYETPDTMLQRSYDFIIVGGGTAGCALASRLSENPAHSVLLLELGAGYTFFSNLPSMLPFALILPFNTYYVSQEQGFNCGGYRNQRCRMYRGTNLGGSSLVNYMTYTRGNKRDYDRWEQRGNKGWGYSDVLPYFKKMEDTKDPVLALDETYHGTGGPLPISRVEATTPLAKAWLQAGEELGYDIVDYNGKNATGFATQQGFLHRARRSSGARSYIKPYTRRSNLHISLYSRVTKILVNKEKEAYGVEVMKRRRRRRFLADKEVIISAGVFETPKLLKLSGIGPAKELQVHRIPLVEDLPVGLQMSSSFTTHGLIWTLVANVSYAFTSIYLNPENWKDYFDNKSGFLGSPAGFEGIAFINTEYQRSKSRRYPDASVALYSTSIAYDGGALINKYYIGLKEEVIKSFLPLAGRHCFTLLPGLTSIKSRGQVFLSSADPAAHPFIRHNFLKHPDDVKRFIEAVKETINIGNSYAFKAYGASLFPLRLPECRHLELWTDDHIECLVRQLVFTQYNDVGTAPMGPADDSEAVVDHRLRVYGVRGLRVVDASVIPEIVSGHGGAAVYMVAEKASDMIKADWHVTNMSPNADWPMQKANNTCYFSYNR